MSTYELHTGDCLELLNDWDPPIVADNSIDAVLTDPPYGLKFMGKEWDHGIPGVPFWESILRVTKPGGHMLAFGGTRTHHRLMVAIEDAGWEIRDCLMWVYGSGFPKSHDVSKAIDAKITTGGSSPSNLRKRAMGDEYRPHSKAGTEGYGDGRGGGFGSDEDRDRSMDRGLITDAARQWNGWGTALKPAWEPIILARKPLTGTVAANVLEWGTGGLNIDGCRIGTNAGWSYPNGRGDKGCFGRESFETNLDVPMAATQGRWPANLIHDGSDEVVGLFPVNKPGKMVRNQTKGARPFNNDGKDTEYIQVASIDDPGGSAARFFYCAKANKKDRNDGCDHLPQGLPVGGADKWTEQDRRTGKGVTRKPAGNTHPTVKPTDLLRYLARLITPSNGTILDPFMGSGSTGKAAIIEGFNFVGMDLSADYVKIADARIQHTMSQHV